MMMIYEKFPTRMRHGRKTRNGVVRTDERRNHAITAAPVRHGAAHRDERDDVRTLRREPRAVKRVIRVDG